jgi:hypothetical protein
MSESKVEPVASGDDPDAGRADQDIPVVNQEKQVEQVGVSKDNVKYTTYQRAVSESKRMKGLYGDLQKELEALKLDRMEEDGKFQEAYHEKKNQVVKLEQKLKEQSEAYVWAAVNNKIKSHAVRAGLNEDSTDMFLQTISQTDYEEIEMEGSNPSDEDIERMVQKYKNSKSHGRLFVKDGPKINDLTPNPKVEKPSPNNLSDMSLDEKLAALARMEDFK